MRSLARSALLLFLVLYGALAAAEETALATDRLIDHISSNTSSLAAVADIDHARLAASAGVSTMPPSRALIRSNPATNSDLLALDPTIGLDLPLRTLAYQDEDHAQVAFSSAEFIAARYAIVDTKVLQAYEQDLRTALAGIEPAALAPLSDAKVTPGYGIIQIRSDFAFAESADRIRQAIMSQGDTVWFGDVDYRADAEALGIDLPPARLLLFGGPAPGGMAMTDFPRLGLDAFCQKVLLVEEPGGVVKLYFNDIVALAELHYGSSNKPQAVINQRMRETLSAAVAADNQ